MSLSGGGGGGLLVPAAIGESGDLWLDDGDAYQINLTPGTPKEVNQANSSGGATPLNEGPVSGLMANSGSAGTITINKAGKYNISLSASFAVSGSAIVDGAVYVNNVRRPEIAFDRSIVNANQRGAVGPEGNIDIGLGDLPAVIDVRLDTDTARTLTFTHYSLNCQGVGA